MIFRMLIPFILLLALPDLYIYLCYVRHMTSRAAYHLLWWLPTVIIIVWMATAFIGHFQHVSFMKYIFGAMLCLAIPKIIFMLCSLLGKLAHGLGIKDNYGIVSFDALGVILGLAACCILAYGSLWGWRQLTVREVTFESADIPEAFDGYRIAQFTDMHIGTQTGNVPLIEKMVRLINDQQADLIAFTGDLVNGSPDELEPGFIQQLSQLKAKDGVFSVLGNHDYCVYGTYRDQRETVEALQKLKQVEQEELHWNLLLNDNRIIRRGNDSLAILGVENDGNPPFPQYGDLTRASKGVEEGCFQVLLSHDPTHWRRRVLPETGIQLTLSGHTHATQFKLGSFSPSRWVYQDWDGLYTENGRGLFVSSGMGAVMFPFRFGAWPEVVVITLKKK
ncbi:MAG: metallophosphoesterase [Bacteroidaceae bacterium]|nr:metallophosphoesterase [Bacteroidaceae bacterium]